MLKTILDFLYPSFCLCCEKKINQYFLCEGCLQRLDLLEPISLTNYFATFEKNDVFSSLYNEYKKQSLFGLNKALAAYMAIQLMNLQWSFDVITSFNSSFYKKDRSYYLAKNLSKIFKLPIGSKPKKHQRVLLISDFMSEDILTRASKGLEYRKIMGLGLTFNVSANHLNLTR